MKRWASFNFRSLKPIAITLERLIELIGANAVEPRGIDCKL
jgi:hypothetical protein